MAGLFYNLGRMMGPQVRKGKWVWKSLTADADEAVLAEYEVGLDIASGLKTTLAISDNREAKILVGVAGAKLASRVANRLRKFTFFVYDDNTPNAFAVPGGFVFVSSSLLSLYDMDADMAAFVLAHEMGHIVRKHAVNRLINGAAVSAVTKALPAQGKLGALLKSTGVKFFQSAYSQSQEIESDIFGVKLMKAAGFDAEKSIKALERLAAAHNRAGNAVDEYFSTHPSTLARIQAIRDNCKF